MVGRIVKISCLTLLVGGLGGCVTGASDDSVKPAEESIETYELDKATQDDLLDTEVQGSKATAPAADEKSDAMSVPADVDTSTLTVDPLEEPATMDQATPASSDDNAATKANDTKAKKKSKKK